MTEEARKPSVFISATVTRQDGSTSTADMSVEAEFLTTAQFEAAVTNIGSLVLPADPHEDDTPVDTSRMFGGK